jgi:lipocalin
MYSLLFVFAIICSASAVTMNGTCPMDVTTQQMFDGLAYTGRWFEIEKYFTSSQANGICATADYGLLPNGTVTVYNHQINGVTGVEESIRGTAEVVGDGQLEVDFPSTPGPVFPYWVLETDYVNYAVVWSCVEMDDTNSQLAWIMSRTPTLSAELLTTAYEVFERNGISTEYLEVTDQSDCTYPAPPVRN